MAVEVGTIRMCLPTNYKIKSARTIFVTGM